MSHRFLRSQSVLVVIAEELIQEVNSFIGNVPLIFRRDKSRPGLLWISTDTANLSAMNREIKC